MAIKLVRPDDEATVTVLEPLTAEIIDALRYFRGACHRKQVIEFIEVAHRKAGQGVDGLADAVISAFERHLGNVRDDPRPFRLPLGPDSHRWALADSAMKG
ncbi:MAG: outer rane efflux protein [Caulobacter sp.]|nr:outer rane efflux protein [Caulobacter sp.]